jgi:cytochrome c oxidase subunit 2
MVQARQSLRLTVTLQVFLCETTNNGTSFMKLKTILTISSSLAILAGYAAARPDHAPKTSHDPQTITIRASRFAFDPNEITVKKGEPVKVIIQSEDVSHGLVVEDLGIRTEVKKGQAATITFTPEAVGTFAGKCAHFCGSGHGSMTLTVHVVEPGAQ